VFELGVSRQGPFLAPTHLLVRLFEAEVSSLTSSPVPLSQDPVICYNSQDVGYNPRDFRELRLHSSFCEDFVFVSGALHSVCEPGVSEHISTACVS
jgi:hypothetical protein